MNATRLERAARWTLLCALAAYAVAALAIAVAPRVARFFMERFHLRTESFVLWALGAPAPWIYNFENRALVSPRPLSDDELATPPEGVRWYPVNHQPTSVMTFIENRSVAYAPGTSLIYLETRYRTQQIRSVYMLTAFPAGSGEPWRLERVEPAP